MNKKLQLLKTKLDESLIRIYRDDFINADPIQIPKQFSKKEDIEIMGFLTATIAWGQRQTIINNGNRLIEYFDGNPYDFIIHHRESDLRKLERFVHRTFNGTDLLYFIAALNNIYHSYGSLENAFTQGMKSKDATIENGLNEFRNIFFSLEDYPERTMKHIAAPSRNSACKRLNMFLRWMVRADDKHIDFGIWKNIKPSQLMCPLDIHSGTTARKLGILTRPVDDWKAVEELTDNLRKMNPEDPVIYDFVLYGESVLNKLKGII